MCAYFWSKRLLLIATFAQVPYNQIIITDCGNIIKHMYVKQQVSNKMSR